MGSMGAGSTVRQVRRFVVPNGLLRLAPQPENRSREAARIEPPNLSNENLSNPSNPSNL